MNPNQRIYINNNTNKTRRYLPSDQRTDVSKTINVLQWNCQGLRSKIPILQNIAYDYDVICIQESILYRSSSFHLTVFSIVRGDITGNNLRGKCTLIRNNITFAIVDLSSFFDPSIEILGIVIEINNLQCLFVNFYRHPGRSTPFSIMNNLLKLQEKFDLVLLVGDFNCHHLYWGNAYDDGPGRSLAKAIDYNSFVILNDKSPMLILSPGSRNLIINLLLFSRRLAPLCLSKTLGDAWGSDH